MGFGGGTKTKPQFSGLQVQSASQTLPVALCYGEQRIPPNLWWYGDFASHKHKQGKGGGGKATSYTYSASVILGLCEGPIHGVGKVWKDQGEAASYTDEDFSLFVGTMPQAPWGYLTTAHPSEADSYPGGAYLAAANKDLGASATISSFSFEVQGLLWATGHGGGNGADPAQLIDDYLSNADHGVHPVMAQVIDYAALYSSGAATTTGDSAFQTYCRANGFELSPGLAEQEAAADAVERWCIGTNTAPVWTGYSLKFVPYGDQTVSGNGVTWLPPTAAVFAFGDDDYVQNGDKDPVIASRSDPADAKNVVKMTVRDRAKAYQDTPVDYQDDNAVWLYGPKEAGAVTLREITDPALGKRIVTLYGQRILYTRNQYRFTTGPAADLLEPMDYGTIDDAKLGVGIPVRLIEIDEQENDDLDMIAEHFSGALGTPSLSNAATNAATNPNSLVAPSAVNAPIIFEPNADLAQRLFGSASACVVAAVSGGNGVDADPNWGGCLVWVSSDGVTYQSIGEITEPARQGKTTSALAAYGGVNPDAAHTVGVTLRESNGDLAGVSAADAAAGATLSYLGGEILSFETATLTGANAYTLGTALYRGLYGTSAGAHASGVDFARLDGELFAYDLPAAYIGVPLWFKFQSFNLYGQALEDLAGCTAYPFTPAGTGYGGGAAGVPTTPAGLSALGQVQAIAAAWSANPAADNVTGYELWLASGHGAAFGAASRVATVAGLNEVITGLLANQAYTVFLRAVNAIGPSGASAGVDVTTSGLISGGGASASITASEDLFAGAYVNVYWTGAAQRVRLADATDPTKFANGFVLGAIASGAAGVVNFTGMNTSIAPAQAGEIWLSATTPGGYQFAPPTSATNPGGVSQSLGTAAPGTGAAFQPGARLKLAA